MKRATSKYSYEDPKIVRNTFSKQYVAINNALRYAKQEMCSVYVWKAEIAAGEYEYTLRKRTDIIDVHSKHIVHVQPYNSNLKTQLIGRNPKSVRVNERERFLQL